MFFNVLVFSSLFAIFVTPSTFAETLTSTTDAVEISTRANSGLDPNVTQSPEPEWRSNEPRQPQKVVNIDASLHKYRRDGIENLPEHDYRRRYFLDFPEHYQYENELYHRGDKDRQQQQYQQQLYQQLYQRQRLQQHRNRDEAHPVTVQGCPMRDVSRPYPMHQNQGVLQGWLGWRQDDKRYESYPMQVTTATPQVAPSYRNRDYTRYDFSRDKSPYKPRYEAEAGSATRDSIRDIERNPPTWMQPSQPSQPSRNNRIVYYEYNLDDRRPRCHPMDRSCNSRYSAGSSGHGSRFDGHRFQTSDEHYRSQPYNSEQYNSQQYNSQQYNSQPYYNRPEGGRSEDSQNEYQDEDYRNEGRAGGRQNAGIGYVYSIDLPMDRAISPSTAFDYDMGFARKNQGYRHAPMPHLDT